MARLAAQRSEISELRAKVDTLEQELALMVTECEQKKVPMQGQAVVNAQVGRVELEKLKKLLAMREREMSQVKKLARSIVEQRTQLELFFHEALAQVKQEITTRQSQYRYTQHTQRASNYYMHWIHACSKLILVNCKFSRTW